MADVAEVKGLVKALNAAAAGQGSIEVCRVPSKFPT